MTQPVRPWSEYARDEWPRLGIDIDELRAPETDDEPWTPALDYPRATRRQSRTATVVALLALAVFVGLYIAVKGGTTR